MSSGNRLRLLRNNRGLTQEEVSHRVGLKRATYARYETGDNQADYDTLIRLADFFNTSIDYLLGRIENPNPIPNDPGSQKPMWVNQLSQRTSHLNENDGTQLLKIIDSVLEFSGKEKIVLARSAAARTENDLIIRLDVHDELLKEIERLATQAESGYGELASNEARNLLAAAVREYRQRYSNENADETNEPSKSEDYEGTQEQ